MKTIASPLALIATTAPALAHSGHAEAQQSGAFHWLTQPDHAIVIILALVAVALLRLPRPRRALRRLISSRN
ncbi:MAG: hypothetical protein ACRBBV_16325 [Paracoccaceae bacterium]